MSVINKMSKKQALTTLVKVAKLQEKLLKKLASKEEDMEEDMEKKYYCRWCGRDGVVSEPNSGEDLPCDLCMENLPPFYWGGR